MPNDDDRLRAIVNGRKAMLRQRAEDERNIEQRARSDKDDRDEKVLNWSGAVSQIAKILTKMNQVLKQAEIELRFSHEVASTPTGPVGYGEFSVLVQTVPSRMSLRLSAMADGTVAAAYAPGPHPKDAPHLPTGGLISELDSGKWKSLMISFTEYAVAGAKT